MLIRNADEGVRIALDSLRANKLRAGLTSEEVRSAMQALCDERGCDLPDDAIVSHGPQSAIGHESGHGEIGAGEVVIVDIWPRDRTSRCWADMTRTFIAGGGEPPAELAQWWALGAGDTATVQFEALGAVTGSPELTMRWRDADS